MTLSMMSPQTQGKWLLRSVATLLWALAAASAVYWGSRVVGPGPGAAVAVPEAPGRASADDAPARQAALARILGALPPAAAGPGPGPAERFALLGVIASVTGKGAALISVDGQPARPLSVGAQIAPGYVLKAVGRREAVLSYDAQAQAQAPVQTILSLPAPGVADAVAEPAARIATAALAEPAAAAVAVAVAPSVTVQIPDAGPPARADSRYPPPASLRRQERQSP